MFFCKYPNLYIKTRLSPTLRFQRNFVGIETHNLSEMLEEGTLKHLFIILQGESIYRAKNNRTGEEGLIFASNMREREALRVDPSLSIMP